MTSPPATIPSSIQVALGSLAGHAESRMEGLPHYRLLHAVVPPDLG